jgi:FKBP-type peptidyl-prolyl cis-trans isomerase
MGQYLSMQKLRNLTVILLAAGSMFLGNAYSQAQQASPAQTAPAKTQSTKPKTATAPKPHTATAAKSATTLATQKEKFSYALGMNLGTNLGANLHKQSVDFDPNMMAQGVKDGLAGGKTLLTEDEAKSIIMEVQKQVQTQQAEKAQAEAAANKKEGDAFLAANKTKEGVVALPSGLQYKILKAGTGQKPVAGDTVVCNYRGTLINGTEFDSSYKRGQPVTFPLSGVIKGWTEALQLMPVGSKWQLFIPSDLAYGEHAPGPEIGPNQTLIFEVELLSIQPNDAGKKPEDNKTGENPSKPQQ